MVNREVYKRRLVNNVNGNVALNVFDIDLNNRSVDIVVAVTSEGRVAYNGRTLNGGFEIASFSDGCAVWLKGNGVIIEKVVNNYRVGRFFFFRARSLLCRSFGLGGVDNGE